MMMLATTKLQIPPLRAAMVDRTRLLDKLSGNRSSRLVLVVGQAGSGKTSLVSQWIRTKGLNAVWYSLDESDDEGDTFFRYLLTGFAKKGVSWAEVLGPFIQGQRRLTVGEAFPFLVDCLSRTEEDTYLVLDDYHQVTSPDIHDGILYLLHYMPAHAHLVIASRIPPPFSLATLSIRDQITEISAADMCFTDEEGAAFLTRTMSLSLSADQVRESIRYSEGWVGGLQLIGLALRGAVSSGGSLRALKTLHRSAADYLIGEIIDVQQGQVADFLHATVFLNRFNEEVCRVITGIEESRKILDYLLRINLFLVPLDAEGMWYRYHHLFSESVRRSLETVDPSMSSGINRKAAEWFAANGFFEDAFQHAFAANDYEFAATMLEDYLIKFFDHYSPASVSRWLKALPRNVFMRHPQLRLDECNFTVLYEQFDEASRVLAEIDQGENAYDGFKKIRFQNNYLYQKYSLPYFKDPTCVNIEWLKAGMSELTSHTEVFGLTLDSTLAGCYIRLGEESQAEEVLKRNRVEVFSSKSAFRRILWFRQNAELERWRGNLGRSSAAVEAVSALVNREKLTDTPLRYFVYVPSAWISYMRNDIVGAFEQVSTGLSYAQQAMYAAEELDATYLLSLVHHAKDDAEQVALDILRMKDIASRSGPHTRRLAEAHIAYVSALSGDKVAADAWCDRRKPSLKERFSITLAYECLIAAMLLLLHGDYRRSANGLRSLRKKCESLGLFHFILQIDILLAAVLFTMDERVQARTAIERSIWFSEREEYLRPFVEHQSLVAPVLFDYTRNVKPFPRSSHLFHVLDSCGLSHGFVEKSGLMHPNSCSILTKRETEILRLIAAGFKTGEIARKTFVSPETIKTHTKHIFGKLDVRTKAEAIQRARQSGLID